MVGIRFVLAAVLVVPLLAFTTSGVPSIERVCTRTLNRAVASVSTESTLNASVDEERLLQLDRAIAAFGSSESKKFLDDIREMRNKDEQGENITNSFLDSILDNGPDRRLPFWTNFGVAAKYSKRARLASLRRTLDLTTPPPSMEEETKGDDGSDVLGQKRRRRRALVSLLRTLSATTDSDKDSTAGQQGPTSSSPAILQLERKARKEQRLSRRKDGRSNEDLTSRRPSDLETPAYEVLVERKSPTKYEIRRYKPFSVCSVSMKEPRPENSEKMDAKVSEPSMGGAKAFGALAGYLFGKNQEETSMKMTTPVLTYNRGDDRVMSFVLPSEFWNDGSLDQAPRPIQGSGVELQRNEGGDRAVIMFGGYATKKVVDEKRKNLVGALEKDKDWKITEGAAVSVAQYNDPFTPPWKRLNEVSVAVQKRS